MTFPDAARKRPAAFTIAELLVATAVFGIFSAIVLTIWSTMQFSALNLTSYAQRQNDQMRALDYLKRDIHRASTVQIYKGGTLVTNNSAGDELRVIVPDYYADTREEDNAIGSSAPNTPILSSGNVSYGGTITVVYYVLNGAVIRSENGVARSISDAAGAFAVSFNREASGDIRCRVSYNQPMRGGSWSRVLRRQTDTLCRQRADLQL